MRKCKIYEIISKPAQKMLATEKLKREWVSSSKENSYLNFKQPSDEAIDTERSHFPLSEFIADAHFHEWSSEGCDGEVWPVAIVELEDGSVQVVDISRIIFQTLS